MKKVIVFIEFLSIFCALAAYGQSQILQKINSIKSQSDIYYWNQYAHPNADSARINVVQWLLAEINVSRDETSMLSFADIADKVKHIKMERGGIIRDFAYIAKAEVEPERPRTKQDTPIENPVPSNFTPDIFVQKVMQQYSFQQVYGFLRNQKAEGVILQFGALKEVDDYSSFDLILFDLESQIVITLLSGETPEGNRTNMLTGQPDSLDNYPEDLTAVIWYIKK